MADGHEKRPFTKYDLILLPLIAIATLLLLAIPAELAFRAAYPQVLQDSCVTSEPGQPFARAKPNCVSQVKAAEGPWTSNEYNACGYRTPEPCGPKPSGTIRFAVIGSSTGAGFLTPYSSTLSARASAALTHACHRPVEFQNLGVAGEQNTKIIRRAQEALSLHPDAILIVVSPFDFEVAPEVAVYEDVDRVTPLRRLKAAISQSRLLYMASYSVLRDDGSYLPVYLRSAHNPDFMRSPLPARWQQKLVDFDTSISAVATMAKRDSIPAMLVFVPQRAQVALIASGTPPADLHPHVLPDLLRKIAKKHGTLFSDSTTEIPKRIASSRLFYALNGHINELGHAMVARAILRRLAARDGPSFMKSCAKIS